MPPASQPSRPAFSDRTLELWAERVAEVRRDAAEYVRTTGITQVELSRRMGYDSHYSVHKFLLPEGCGRWEPKPNERSRRFLESLTRTIATRDRWSVAEDAAEAGRSSDPLERSSEELKVSAHRRHLQATTAAFPGGRALNHYDELIEDALHWDEPRARFRMATNTLFELVRCLYELVDTQNWTCPSAVLLERRLVDVGRLADRALSDHAAYASDPWVACLVRHYAACARAAGGLAGLFGSGPSPVWEVALRSGFDELVETAALDEPSEVCLTAYRLATDGELDNVKKVALRNHLYLVERCLALDLDAAPLLAREALEVAQSWPALQVALVLTRFRAERLLAEWRGLDPAYVEGLELPDAGHDDPPDKS